MTDTVRQGMIAALRKLVDALECGDAQVDDWSVVNDVELVDVPADPPAPQRTETIFRGQRIAIRATSRRVVLGDA